MKKIFLYINIYRELTRKYVGDFALLAIRILLAVAFAGPAIMKISNIEATAQWFSSMGIPLPTFNAYMASGTEILGVVLLSIGLATEIIALPLLFIMLIAIITVHYQNGWLAIASSENTEIASRLTQAKNILLEHGNYDWLTEKGYFVILNNGMEFPVIYIVLLLILMAFGAGKFSVDFLFQKRKKYKN